MAVEPELKVARTWNLILSSGTVLLGTLKSWISLSGQPLWNDCAKLPAMRLWTPGVLFAPREKADRDCAAGLHTRGTLLLIARRVAAIITHSARASGCDWARTSFSAT